MHTDSGFDLTTLDSLRAAFLNISDEDQERQLQAGHTNVDDVKSAMKDLEEILAKSRGVTKLEGVLSDISQVFDQLSLLVDPLAQLHAPVAPIVWGSVKIILQLAKGRKDVIEAIIDAFISMANNIPRICSYAGHRPTDLATTALSAAFREIVAFLIDVAKYLQQSSKCTFHCGELNV
ncbi:hypothetical protein JAAARDRAFT_572379 [Jaapia argillacea MUCL 33604]|uniref:DUF7708 domain-containing protein n=1 Tax=Jaapia argillacea MUCL 33604 TaxID=933084 RepID=A0A067Q2A7_9AGAM|nr:hypothetical protein JAAARDRAFT_572379 [Jaapia argillacea MUCL 33604]